jgi:hypothetical protein
MKMAVDVSETKGRGKKNNKMKDGGLTRRKNIDKFINIGAI